MTNSKLRFQPVPATVLAETEARRRDALRLLRPCSTGCDELDSHVLLCGGFERGCVVGLSAEDEEGVGIVVSSSI